MGEFVHQLAAALAAPDDGEADDAAADPVKVTLFSSSWKDRLGRPGAVPLPSGVAAVDRRIPVRLLNLAWHRAEWPPIEALTGQRFDVVHSPHPLLLPSRTAAQVITIHDLDFLDHPERTSGEVRRDYPALVRGHARRAAQVIVPSRYTAGQVARRLNIPPDAISLCWNGPPAWTPRAAPPCRGHLLFVGTLAPRKNVGRLLAAYAQLLRQREDLPELVIAGGADDDGRGSDCLRALEEPPLAGRVRRTGYVTKPALKELYTNACALVLPSLDEGFGLPALEAMTLGVPVVASNRGALPEVVGDAGLLVNPTNTDLLASTIARLLDDPGLAATCALRGIARAKSFSWQASARALRGAYARAIAAHERIAVRSTSPT